MRRVGRRPEIMRLVMLTVSMVMKVFHVMSEMKAATDIEVVVVAIVDGCKVRGNDSSQELADGHCNVAGKEGIYKEELA